LTTFATQLLIVKAELEQLQACDPDIYQEFAAPQGMDALSAAFEGARGSLSELHKSCSRLQRANSRSLPSRLRSAYLERPAVDKLLRNIRDTES